MADIERIIPHILKWEGGAVRKGASNRELFALAQKRGWSDKKSDRGGKTMCGVTLTTFTDYCRRKWLPTPTADDLRAISYDTWHDILRTMYWNRWQADGIDSQAIANLLVDWVWGSGVWGIRLPQRVLAVADDGIVGPKTLDAVNGGDAEDVFRALWKRREQHFRSLARLPGQGVNLAGWLNRLGDLTFFVTDEV